MDSFFFPKRLQDNLKESVNNHLDYFSWTNHTLKTTQLTSLAISGYQGYFPSTVALWDEIEKRVRGESGSDFFVTVTKRQSLCYEWGSGAVSNLIGSF